MIRQNFTRILICCFFFADIEAECQDDYMKIRIGFNGSFTGLLYSAGKQKKTNLIKVLNLE